jgi:tripartite-type tricarboxylate transporter receptor subunit TctC
MTIFRTGMKPAPVLALLLATTAGAQTYPAGPMNMVVPFPPGGGTDILGRAIAQKLNEAWGQPVIVENRAGANGVIGTAHVARSAPDGHTMLIVPGGLAVNPAIRKSLPYDTLKDLAPVTQLASSPLVLAVHPSFPPRSVKELVVFAKARPDQINFGTSGNGSPPHMAAELFKHLAGIRMTHIPYKGAGPAAIDLISGQIALYFMNALQVVPYVRSGQVRALGLSNTTRSPALPGVPTIAEAGVPGYDVATWWGVLAPGKTPAPVVNRLNEEIRRIVASGDVKARIVADGAEPVADMPAAQFNALLKSDIEKWRRIVKERNIKTN